MIVIFLSGQKSNDHVREISVIVRGSPSQIPAHIHLQLYTMFNTKRFGLSVANGENQKQAPKQILVFNHRALTKASGLITEQ